MTLTEFLLARIAEDEATAKMAGGAPYPWRLRMPPDLHPALAGHLEANPAHVLADCEAKRSIVEQVDAWQRSLGGQQTKDALEVVARRLATAYADHPDYPAATARRAGR